MSRYETVRYKQDDAIAIVTLNRPAAMNSFNATLRRELSRALQDAASEPSVRAVVLTGEGRCFSAGADLNVGLDTMTMSIEEMLQKEYRPIFECIASMPKPVIAAVNGSAAGIGMSYALACDLLIMGDNAFLLSPFTNISMVPDGGLNWFLVQQLGYRLAFQLSVESERIPANRCVELGLANRAVPADSLFDEAVSWARRLAERAPLSVAATKKMMRHAVSGSWASTYDLEAPAQDVLRSSEDCLEGIDAFLNKRKPRFHAR